MRRAFPVAFLAILCLTRYAAAAQFVVKVPEQTPKEARVYLAGSGEELGNWKPDGIELKRSEDGSYRVDVPLDLGQTVEFKVTLGSWETVEKSADGSERGNRLANIDAAARQVEVTVERWASMETRLPSSVVGTLKLHTIDSTSLGKQRTVRVWLPVEYEANQGDRFPVLYMHDGQNCFDRATSAFGNEWQIDESLTTLIEAKRVKPIIVVAIDNGGADRIAEYTFVADPGHGGGCGERYSRFLLDEVRPLINRAYRTQVGRGNTFIGGSSLGGILSLEIAKRHPDVFGGVIAMSPSLWWSGDAIVSDLERDAARLAATRIWIDTGTREGDDENSSTSVELVRRVDAILNDHKVEHRTEISDGARHNEPAWAARFPTAIEYLVGP